MLTSRRRLLYLGLACYVLAALLIGVLVAHAQSPYSIALSPTEDAELAVIVGEINAQRTAENVIRAAQTPPGTPLSMLTARQYLQSLVDGHTSQWIQQRKRDSYEAASGTWATRSPAQKARICVALALSPCPQ